MLLLIFRSLLILIFLTPNLYAVDEITADLRKEYYLVKGISENFYDKWIAPFQFHLKWQVGQSLSFYNNEDRAEIEAFEKRHNSRRMNFDFDLLGLYFRFGEKRDLFGLSLGTHSDSSIAKGANIQVDHYSARLSWISFHQEFRKGYYHRLDAGILWRDFLSSSDSGTIRRRGAGATAKMGFGKAIAYSKSSLTLEGDYEVSYYSALIGHNFSFNIGFIY